MGRPWPGRQEGWVPASLHLELSVWAYASPCPSSAFCISIQTMKVLDKNCGSQWGQFGHFQRYFWLSWKMDGALLAFGCQAALQHTGRPCPTNWTIPDSILGMSHLTYKCKFPAVIIWVPTLVLFHIQTQRIFAWFYYTLNFSGMQLPCKWRRDCTLFCSDLHCFRKSHLWRPHCSFRTVSGQFHTFIPVSIRFHHLTPITSPHLVIASHSHSNVHIISL